MKKIERDWERLRKHICNTKTIRGLMGARKRDYFEKIYSKKLKRDRKRERRKFLKKR